MLGNLRGALAGTTVLMVASRPSTIALADDVVYLERGTVVDHGTHDELMARRPAYRDCSRRSRPIASSAPSTPLPPMGSTPVTEPIGRFSAARTIGRGLEEAPVLRQGLGRHLAARRSSAPCGRVVVPILLQQAIDKRHRPPTAGSASASSPCWRPSPPSRWSSRASPSARRSCASARRSEQALFDLRTRLIAHIHRLSLADHNEERRGALVARVTSDIETLAQFFQWGGLAWLLNGPLMLLVGAVMLAYDWVLALVAFALAAPLVVVLRAVQRHLVRRVRGGRASATAR